MNYDELVKDLRVLASWKPDGEVFERAADAIEELQQTANYYKGCADDWYKEACDYKAALPRWISVKERLPEDLDNVLVYEDGHVFIGHCEHFYGDEEVYVDWHDILYYPITPTHWMPLTDPPKEEP